MKPLTIILLLISSACFAQPSKKYKDAFDKADKSFDSVIVRLGLNQVELVKVQKAWRIIDSVTIKVNERWIDKLNDAGYREEDIIRFVPTRYRDSLKMVIKKQ